MEELFKLINNNEQFRKLVVLGGFIGTDEYGGEEFIEVEKHYWKEELVEVDINSLIQGLLTTDELDWTALPVGTKYQYGTKQFENMLEEHGIEYEHIEQEGGGEGEGESVHAVFRIGEHFYRADWLYFSYHGYEGFDNIAGDLYEVVPTQIEVTIYPPKGE